MNETIRQLHKVLLDSTTDDIRPPLLWRNPRYPRARPYECPEQVFDLNLNWDLDSTPSLVRALSRRLNIRTPALEAAIACASFGHDIRYYYGGTREMKSSADAVFAEEIRRFVCLIDEPDGRDGSFVSRADRLAVRVGGQPSFLPFIPSSRVYAWSYGLPVARRGYLVTQDAQASVIERLVGEFSKLFVSGAFTLNCGQISKLSSQGRVQLQNLLEKLSRTGDYTERPSADRHSRA